MKDGTQGEERTQLPMSKRNLDSDFLEDHYDPYED